jgi:TubC N-terminal docking domain
MGARDLLNGLAGAGLTLKVEGDRLLIRPASKLTDDLRHALRSAKPELLALLADDAERSARTRARLLRWGWPADEADAMAQRLARRDSACDDRVSCAGDCAHYRPGRCGNHKRAGLASAEVGRDLAGLLQRCPGFRREG